jgi:hypothetical protein
MAGKKRGGEGAGAEPSTSSSQIKRPRSTDAGSFLPDWVESVMGGATGTRRSASSYTLNKSMPSLESRYNGLKKWIPELKMENMAHVSGGHIFCPCMALAGKKVVHSSNGTYVAVLGDVMYANCSDMSCTWRSSSGVEDRCGTEEDPESGGETMMLLVKGTERFGHPWARYTEDNYTKLG